MNFKIEFYVYIYLDPRTPACQYGKYKYVHEPFYIGKGKDLRYKSHLSTYKLKQHSNKNSKIKSILSSGMKPIILKTKRMFTEYSAFKLEVELIKTIGRIDLGTGPLTNKTNGGEGFANVGDSTKKKISNNLLGRLGSEPVKHKSERFKGINNPFYGKKNAPELCKLRYRYLFISTWDIIDNMSLREFCDNNNFTYNSIRRYFQKKKLIQFDYKEWTIYRYPMLNCIEDYQKNIGSIINTS